MEIKVKNPYSDLSNHGRIYSAKSQGWDEGRQSVLNEIKELADENTYGSILCGKTWTGVLNWLLEKLSERK
jgi:hypothetical protein